MNERFLQRESASRYSRVIEVPANRGRILDRNGEPLAVSTPKRIAALPEVPTIAEAGYPDAESIFWLALLAPVKTPGEIVAKVNAEVNRALGSQEMAERLAKLGTEAMAMTPAAGDAFIRREYEALGKIMRDSGATPQ